jgi:hypothetical protein
MDRVRQCAHAGVATFSPSMAIVIRAHLSRRLDGASEPLTLLPRSWHRQITISRLRGQPTKDTARPSEFALAERSEPRGHAGPASLRREIRLSGQFEWPYGGSDDRSGTDKFEAVALIDGQPCGTPEQAASSAEPRLSRTRSPSNRWRRRSSVFPRLARPSPSSVRPEAATSTRSRAVASRSCSSRWKELRTKDQPCWSRLVRPLRRANKMEQFRSLAFAACLE